MTHLVKRYQLFLKKVNCMMTSFQKHLKSQFATSQSKPGGCGSVGFCFFYKFGGSSAAKSMGAARQIQRDQRSADEKHSS